MRNYLPNNVDLIWPTKYPVFKGRIMKKPPLKPKLLLSFKPLPMYNANEYRQPNLPFYIGNKDVVSGAAASIAFV